MESPPGQAGLDQHHGLVADMGPAWGVELGYVFVEQLPRRRSDEVLGQRGQLDEPGVGHHVLIVEGHPHRIETRLCDDLTEKVSFDPGSWLGAGR